MEERSSITVSFFGSLHALRRQRGQSVMEEMPCSARRKAVEIARELDLPIDRIGTVYCNHVARGLDHLVGPGDRIAFASPEVPSLRRTQLASPWG
jgi:hypothetical protein